MKEFDSQVVVITGGTSGIGKATAKKFIDEGATTVLLTADSKEIIDQALQELGEKAHAYILDVSNEQEVEKVFTQIVERFKKIDVAFNNAGIGPDGKRIPYQSLVEVETSTWDKIVDVDLKGVFLCMKWELAQMIKQGHGAIVNTSSIGGYKMAPGFNAYGVAKAGVIALGQMAAIENASKNIRVNTICPGPTQGTQLTNNSFSANPNEKEMLESHVIPMKKLGLVEEVAGAVLWLGSSKASHTTGQTLFIDGGMHIV